MKIVTGVGIGYLEDFFGGGLGFNMNFHGRSQAVISNVDIGPDKQSPLAQSKMDLQLAPAFTAGIYTNLKRVGGSHVNIHIGLTYRQETFLRIEPFQVENITNAGGIDMLVNLAVFDYYTPHYVSAGVAVDIGRLTISAQADWELWSKFRTSAAVIKAFDSLGKAALANGDTRSYEIPKFFDIVIPRVGLSAKVADWLDVMAGYYYQPTFVPNNAVKGIFNFLDNNKHIVSFGVRIGLPRLDFINGPADFIIGGQFQILEKRNVNKTPDPNLATDNSQADTLNPSYSYGGWNPTVTAELSLKI